MSLGSSVVIRTFYLPLKVHECEKIVFPEYKENIYFHCHMLSLAQRVCSGCIYKQCDV